MTLDEINAAILALETALASGQLTVEYDGRRVTYRSASEIETALAYFRRQAQQIPATGPAPSSADRGTYAAFSRD